LSLAANNIQNQCLSSSEGQSKCESELRCIMPRRIQMPQPKDPTRPQSSRGGYTSTGSPALEQFDPVAPQSWLLPPPSRAASGAPSTLSSGSLLSASNCLHYLPRGSPHSSVQTSVCALRNSCMGSTHGSIESLSAFTGNIAARMGTPPGAPNAFEAHMVLVRCPAPKRAPCRSLRPSLVRSPCEHGV